MTEFLIKNKKLSTYHKLRWFEGEESNVKGIIENNFKIFENSKFDLKNLSEEVVNIYNNNSMVNSDILNSSHSLNEEIKDRKSTSARKFNIFDDTRSK